VLYLFVVGNDLESFVLVVIEQFDAHGAGHAHVAQFRIAERLDLQFELFEVESDPNAALRFMIDLHVWRNAIQYISDPGIGFSAPGRFGFLLRRGCFEVGRFQVIDKVEQGFA